MNSLSSNQVIFLKCPPKSVYITMQTFYRSKNPLSAYLIEQNSQGEKSGERGGLSRTEILCLIHVLTDSVGIISLGVVLLQSHWLVCLQVRSFSSYPLFNLYTIHHTMQIFYCSKYYFFGISVVFIASTVENNLAFLNALSTRKNCQMCHKGYHRHMYISKNL